MNCVLGGDNGNILREEDSMVKCLFMLLQTQWRMRELVENAATSFFLFVGEGDIFQRNEDHFFFFFLWFTQRTKNMLCMLCETEFHFPSPTPSSCDDNVLSLCRWITYFSHINGTVSTRISIYTAVFEHKYYQNFITKCAFLQTGKEAFAQSIIVGVERHISKIILRPFQAVKDLCVAFVEVESQSENNVFMYWSVFFLCQDPRQPFFHSSDGPVQHWPIKLNLDYLSLDFQSASPSPVQKVCYNQTTALNCVLQHCTTGALKWTS